MAQIQLQNNNELLSPGGPYGRVLGVLPSRFWGSPVIDGGDGTLICPGFTGNTYADNPWDFVNIMGFKTPGIAEVSVKKERKMDVKKASGRDNARLTYTGMEPALVDIRVTIWTPDQLQALTGLWNYIFPVKKPNFAKKDDPWPPAYTVFHPTLDVHRVISLCMLGGEGPTNGAIPRSKQFIIKCIEYAPPGKTNETKTVFSERSSTFEPDYKPAGSDKKNTGRTG